MSLRGQIRTSLDIQALADSGAIFGLDESNKGEDQFQGALNTKLELITGSDGWIWRRE